MYLINRRESRLEKLSVKSFSELKLAERKDLQEWIVHEPNVFAEDLLILQKEFDGFDGTNERLDLLALDREGRLVLIENKTDDSGRDVVWQALKYVSYCASLTKQEIIGLYQDYLDKYCSDGYAEDTIKEFLQVSDFDETVLNPGNEQRIILVASNFRKEVTSTVLWLLDHSVLVQCFKLSMYQSKEDLFLGVEQIIPVPEAGDYIIRLAMKEADQKSSSTEAKNRSKMRIQFWQRALDTFRMNDTFHLFDSISPTKDHWLSASAGSTQVNYVLVLTRNEVRVELAFIRIKEDNKFLFDTLEKQKDLLEEKFGEALVWDRLDDKISSVIRYRLQVSGFEEENWAEIISWMEEHMHKLEEVFREPLKEACLLLKNQF